MIDGDRVVEEARKYAELQARFAVDPEFKRIQEACKAAYIQGFKAGLTCAVKTATGEES